MFRYLLLTFFLIRLIHSVIYNIFYEYFILLQLYLTIISRQNLYYVSAEFAFRSIKATRFQHKHNFHIPNFTSTKEEKLFQRTHPIKSQTKPK